MSGKPWTDEELAALQRAGQTYHNQWHLAWRFEPLLRARPYDGMRNKGRVIASWRPPPGIETPELRIDTEPEAVAAEIQDYLRRHAASRSVMPDCLQQYVEPLLDAGADLERARPDPTNAEILRLEREAIELRAQLRDARDKIGALQRDETLFEQLSETIRRSVDPLSLPRFSTRAPRKDATPVDGVLLLSDQHADDVIRASGTWGVEQYDWQVYRCRLHRLVDTITKYVTVHLPRHHFERLWIFSLGDALAGDIHGGADRGYFGSMLKAALATGDAQAQAVAAIAQHLPVHLVSVSGNHPRRRTQIKKDYDRGPHDNFDYLVTAQMRTRLDALVQDGRVTVHAPSSWTAFADVRGHLWALNHGEEVKGWSGFPWYGFSRRNNRVQAVVARHGARVEYFAYAHWHQHVEFPDAGGRSYHNGAWQATSEYAAEKLAVANDPVQLLFAVDDARGVILPIPIYLRDEDAEERCRAGTWEPAFGRATILDVLTDGATVGELPVVTKG